MSDPNSSLSSLVSQVLASPKYGSVSPAFIEELGKRELAKGRSLKEAVKAVKNKLHQVGGAYQDSSRRYAAWLEKLQASAQVPDPQVFREACREVMASHASTRERLAILDTFYATVFEGFGPIDSVLDLACGLNPLSIPWMPLSEGARYHAVDIYTDMMAFLNAFMRLAGVAGKVETTDVIEYCPHEPVQVAYVLKTIPCLEQVDRMVAERLLECIPAEHMLVSFPARSLGGRNKGMLENYEARFNHLLAGRRWNVQRFEFSNELVFRIRK